MVLLPGMLCYAALCCCAAAAGEEHVRKSPIAGSWYPGGKEKLRGSIMDLLGKAAVPDLPGRCCALISPHAGMQFSGQAAAYGFKAIQGRPYTRVILMGPSHHAYFSGLATSGTDAYETPLGRVPVDRAVSEELSRLPLFQGPRSAEMPEHSLEMQLPFLQVVLKDFSIVPLVVGELSLRQYEEAGAALQRYADERTVFVVSSDFTHYGPRFGYVPFRDKVKENLARLDGDAITKITAKDFEGFMRYLQETGATICGARPIGILLKLLPAGARGTLLQYYTSGDVLQDYGDSVSYASIVFLVQDAQP